MKEEHSRALHRQCREVCSTADPHGPVSCRAGDVPALVRVALVAGRYRSQSQKELQHVPSACSTQPTHVRPLDSTPRSLGRNRGLRPRLREVDDEAALSCRATTTISFMRH